MACVLIQDFIFNQYSHADVMMIDPELNNTKAIHVYEKVGFKKVEAFCPAFNPKPHVMMHLNISQLKTSKDKSNEDT